MPVTWLAPGTPANVAVDATIRTGLLAPVPFTARADNTYGVFCFKFVRVNVVANPLEEFDASKFPVLTSNTVPAGFVFNPNVTVADVVNNLNPLTLGIAASVVVESAITTVLVLAPAALSHIPTWNP